MRKYKIVGTFILSLLVCSLFVSVCSRGVVGVSGFTAEEKLPALLTDVIGLDLSKYDKMEGHTYYGTTYRYGETVEVEQCGFWLVDTKGDVVTVMSEFYNGFPEWVNIRADTSFHYAIEPFKGSVGELQSFFERYMDFAQKYDIFTVDKFAGLDLFNTVSSNLPTKVSSDDLSLYVSKQSFGLGSIANGVELPNKSLSIEITDDHIVFSDTFGLYSVCDVNTLSKAEFTDFAFEVAQIFCDTFFVLGENDVNIEWDLERSDIGLNMIPGQLYNNPLNNELLEQGVGTSYSKDRDALVLYPMWQARFYFNQNIDNIDGVQVGVWGDTGEIAYCWETGHLGTPEFPLDKSFEQSNSSDTLWGFVVAVLVIIIGLALVVVSIKKKVHI
ncbi:MAG: hypothetical protein FWH37_00255 [Candidatus Bathyarchaeota archaeon]|nr:hypothetical protein [Candidatus Termiticorpusculum sp.]